MQRFNIADFLPMFPWEGLPLPRFLGLSWSRLQGSSPSSLPALSPRDYISSIDEPAIAPYKALATYQNEESWEIDWNEEGQPTKVVVKRHATKS